MRKAIIGAAAVAALIAAAMCVPAQARMFDPTLNSTLNTTVTVAWHHHYRGWRAHYARSYRHYHCWIDWHGFRHCGWSYY